MGLSQETIERLKDEYRSELVLSYALEIEDTELALQNENLGSRLRANGTLLTSLAKILKEAKVDVKRVTKEVRDSY